MKARYKYRFYPTAPQKKSLAQLFGCVRVVFNDALVLCKKSDKLPKITELSTRVITQAKKTAQRSWLSEVSSVALQQSLRDLAVAYKNFFDSLKGKRKGKKIKSPKFKKRRNQQTARLTRNAFFMKNGVVYLAKIGIVKPVWSRDLPSISSSETIIKDCADRYFLSFVVEMEKQPVKPTNKTIGIDLGIKSTLLILTPQSSVYHGDRPPSEGQSAHLP
jgi:putative transposase